MNVNNVLQVINDLSNLPSDNFFLARWQAGGEFIYDTVKDVIDNGIKVDIGGLIAVSDHFKQQGGLVGLFGEPVIEGNHGINAVSEYLGISFSDAYLLLHGINYEDIERLNDAANNPETYLTSVYGIPVNNVTPKDVISELEKLIELYTQENITV